MNTRTMILLAAASVASTSAFSEPTIVKDSVSVVQEDAGSGAVKIDYELSGENAVITIDVCTNGVSIGGENIGFLIGDVNRVVEPGERTILWKAYKSWPGHKITDGSISVSVKAWSLTTPPDYMVIDCEEPYGKRYYPSAEFVPFGVSNDIYKTKKLVMRKIPAAGVEWRMGEGPNYAVTANSERCVPHYVSLSEDYYMGIYELTQGQMLLLSGAAVGSFTSSAKLPIESCSYNSMRGATYSWPTDEHKVGGYLATMRDRTGVDLDLPTDAQWEFACRAGVGTQLYDGNNLLSGSGTDANLEKLAWYCGNSPSGTREVGQKVCNGYGLYDMLGNVWEYCLDNYEDLKDETVTDPKGPNESTFGRVKRGGSYADTAIARNRAAYRHYSGATKKNAYDGFRLACPAVAK